MNEREIVSMTAELTAAWFGAGGANEKSPSEVREFMTEVHDTLSSLARVNTKEGHNLGSH